MRVLLDTQTFIYAIDEGRHLDLPARARRALLDPENSRELSVLSISEIALKAANRRLGINPEQVRQGLKLLCVSILPLKPEHVLALFQLPLHHSDPLDRMIIATALVEDVPIVSGDPSFRQYRGLKIVW